jgi:hypothetical protein
MGLRGEIVEHIFAFLVCMFIVIVFGLFSIFTVRNMYVSQSSFLQEEAVLALRQLLESPLNETKIPPTIGIAMKYHPYVINITAVQRLRDVVLRTAEDYNRNKTGLVSSEDDVRIILYNGTEVTGTIIPGSRVFCDDHYPANCKLVLGTNTTRSKVFALNGYAFCPPGSCLSDGSFCCPSSGNITVRVIVTGD